MANISAAPSFKVMLVDDHELFCNCVEEIITKAFPNCIFCYYTTIKKACEALEKQDYQLLFCDLLMPEQNAEKFIIDSRRKYPFLSIVILSSIINMNVIKDFFSQGVNGYLSKNINHHELKIAIEKLYAGERYISADLSNKLATSIFETEKNNLTKKEVEVLRLVATGNTVINIAKI